MLAIGTENGKVIMHFGEPCSWIGFNPDQAIDIAKALIKQAKIIDVHGTLVIEY